MSVNFLTHKWCESPCKNRINKAKKEANLNFIRFWLLSTIGKNFIYHTLHNQLMTNWQHRKGIKDRIPVPTFTGCIRE